MPTVSQVPITGVTISDVAEWVGIDGYNSPDVCQAGILETVQTSGGHTTISFSAWVEWYPASADIISASSFQVNPGDTIEVTVETTGAGATKATCILDDETTGQIYDTSLTAPSGTKLQGNCAEVVVETPELISGSQVSQPLLTDFLNSPVVFQGVSATYSNGLAASLSSAQSIGMWTDNVPGSNGSVQEAYGSIQPTSDSVTATEDNYWGGSASTSNLGPTLTAIVDSPSSGDLNAGKTVTITLDWNEAATVANGTPTLSLNDGGTATYSGSSGDDLNFSYSVLAGQNTSELVVSSINLNGATITDGSGNNANLSLTGLTQSGPQIHTTGPTVASILAATDTGSLEVNGGHLVTVTMNLSEVVTVTGTPTLQLNDNEVAVYAGGSGTDALTFAYVVQTGDNTPDLQVTGLNLPNGASIVDGAGNSLSNSVTGDLGIEVNATAAASVQQEINGLYVALYGVAATGPGVTYWINQALAHDSSETLASADSTAPIPLTDAQFIGEQFVETQATYFQSEYGSLTDAQFVQALYSNIGGSSISNTVDLNYWSGQLQAAEATLGDADNGLLARASVIGQFVHDLISNNLYPFGANAAENAAYFGLSASDYAAVVADQQSCLDKIAVSQSYAQNATATGPGSILNYTTEFGPAWTAAQTILADVTANPVTASTAIVGINNAVAHQDLALM